MSFRLRAFALHLFASASLLSVVLAVLYLGWYSWPGWYLLGAETIVGLMLLVDVGIGPLGTLVVANPAKPSRELMRDIALIVIVQLMALGYGAQTLWSGRPLYYAFSLDRIEIVTSSEFDQEVIDSANKKGAAIIPGWSSRPTWIWAPLPDDPALRNEIIASALTGGHDVTSRPEYFHPLPEGAAAMRERYIALPKLVGKGFSEHDYEARLATLDRPADSLGALPIEGRTRDGIYIFDRASGEPVAFWNIPFDWAAAKKSEHDVQHHPASRRTGTRPVAL